MIETVHARLQQFATVLSEFPEVRYLGDPVLRTPTTATSLDEGIKIAQTLGETLKRYRAITGAGRGLAAPQIGIGKAVFVTFIDDQLEGYLNPRVVKKSEERNLYRELCISSGIMWGDVERSSVITLEWMDEAGNMRSKEFDGVSARLLQHEEAHLRAEVNLDIATPGTIEICTSDPLKEQLRDAHHK